MPEYSQYFMRTGVFLLATLSIAQTTEPLRLPEFEVASVKANTPQDRRPGKMRGGPGTDNPNHIYATNTPLILLIMHAYELKPALMRYLCVYPGWMDDARYDLTAGVPDGASQHEANLMMQRLLMNRFHLKTHRERRLIPIYRLKLAKDGLRIRQAVDDSEELSNSELKNYDRDIPEFDADVLKKGVLRIFSVNGTKRIIIKKQPLDRLANVLSVTVERLVVDQTGAQGKYSFALSWTTPARAPQPDSDADSGVSIFTALQRQLGLKLEPGKQTVEIFVVDSADRIPTEN